MAVPRIPSHLPLLLQRVVLLSILGVALCGCSPGALLGLSANNATLQRHSALVVRVNDSGVLPQDAIAVLYQRRASGEQLFRYSRPTGPDSYVFLVPPGEHYRVAVFLDRNRNLRIDDGEPLGWAWGNEGVRPRFGDRILLGETRLTPGATVPSGLERNLATAGASEAPNLPIAFGEVADLGSAIFSPAYGKKGYWRAAEFLRESGVGVYFLGPYQPEKIPVLFVYGVNGTPRNFQAMFDGLDRTRYQPWFFHYATGVRIDDAATALNEIIRSLHTQYRFADLYIVAHSMGGLVARSMLLKHLKEEPAPYVRLFVSLSTPWGGIDSTARGVRESPVIIPAWIDLQPQGEFLKTLYARSLKPAIEFQLFYGHRASRFRFLDDDQSDGTVTVETQLDARARNDATQVVGFDEDHDNILQSHAVITALNDVLQRAAARARSASRPRP